MSTVEDAIVAQLAATVTAAVLTAGTNVRRGPVQKAANPGTTATRAIPGECVFVQETTGLKSMAYSGSRDAIEPGFAGLLQGEAFPSVQIWVRSKPNDFNGGQALAIDVLHSIDRKPPAGFYEAESVTGSPNAIRKDSQDHYEWSVNVNLRQQRC